MMLSILLDPKFNIVDTPAPNPKEDVGQVAFNRHHILFLTGPNSPLKRGQCIELDETQWSMSNLHEMINKNKGKVSVGSVRKMQIEDTGTEHFMILDGDEIHFRDSMKKIIEEIIPKWKNNDIICGLLINPL